jgi:membrane protein DedA with SNARE-associated domain/membrane-associated phospholipid phosphatase
MHIIDSIQNIILPNLQHIGFWGYWIAFFATLLETILIIGLFVPGSTIVLIFGALAANGFYDFGDLMWFAIVAALLGDNINYYIGRKYGYAWANNKWFIKESHFEKGKRFFDTYGAKSLFLGRLIPGLKETFPFIAGSVRMDMKKFIFWDLLGCIIWSLEFLSAGYIFGSSLALARAWLGHFALLVSFIFLLFVLFYAMRFLIIKHGKDIWLFQKSIFYSVKANPDVVKFTQKHSKLFSFLARRFDLSNFYGLTVTFLSILFVYLIISFLGLVLDITHFGQIAQFDVMFANLLASFRNMNLVKIFLFFTVLGNTKTIIVFLFAVISILFIYKKRNYILPLLLSVVSSITLDNLIKYLIHRPRPPVAVYHEPFYSFPSGHATISVAFYGFLAYILIREIKNLKIKLNILFSAFLIIFLIGLSRIYLCVHYFSDVWGGYILGATGVLVGIALNEQYLFKKNQPKNENISSSSKIAIAFTVLISIAFYIYLGLQFHPKLLSPPKEELIAINSVEKIFKNEKMKYTYTILGARQEPINFILIAKNDNALVNAIKKAKWNFAQRLNIASIKKFIKSFTDNKAYPNAPISPDFWDYRVNNFGIEESSKSVKVRHHGRIWRTPFVINGDRVYVAAVSFDEGFRWVVHKISPYVDGERKFFFKCLKDADVIKRYELIKLTKPLIGKNFYGDQFFTDGKAYVIWIKK